MADISPNLSVQVTARAKPICKVIAKINNFVLIELVAALAAPDFGVMQEPKSANTAERDKKDKHEDRTIAEDANFVSLFNCEDST